MIFNNGSLATPGAPGSELLIGGEAPMENLTLRSNQTYGGAVGIGYSAKVRNRGIEALRNCFAGSARFVGLEQITFKKNTIIAPGTIFSYCPPAAGGDAERIWDQNEYLRTKVEYGAINLESEGKSRAISYSDWQKQTGHDGSSTYREEPASGTRVAVRANTYERGRGHIVVYNWSREPEVWVNLEGVLARGQRYWIVSAQNLRGAPVFRGTWTGDPIRLPIRAQPAATPVGLPNHPLPVMEPLFGVYLVRPEAG